MLINQTFRKMRNHNYLNIQVFIFIGIMCISNFAIYGQEIMEDARVSVSFLEENKTNTIKALVTDQSGLPIEELDLYFYVKRTFSLLPIGDIFNTTDENGMVTIDFPDDLPGDTEGNVTIVVKIIESDLYKDFSMEIIKDWGVPVVVENSQEKRSLWAAAANAPMSLIVATSSMILVIWFIICYIIFVLYKISKIRPFTS